MMQLRWSYLNSYFLKQNKCETFTIGDSSSLFQSTLFLTKYGNFKIFKKTVKFRKHATRNSQIVRRRYILRKRLLNNLKISIILRYWAKTYKKLRQFWRFYQNSGIFNLDITIPNFSIINKSFRSGNSFNYITTSSLPKKLFNISNNYALAIKDSPSDKLFLPNLTKYSSNSSIHLTNSDDTLNYVASNKFLNTGLVKYKKSYSIPQILPTLKLSYSPLKHCLIKKILLNTLLIRKIQINLIISRITLR
uniref:Uncharacterized protein n=1 Tax=Strombidium cf. sulcatum TaxID=2793073 RepID=A0A7T0Q5D8_9SPIT|nr:hypothetical protein J6674_mgp36 [Strombidium cf. sulcatum]QPL15953.1 hypothetical protein [Strombidium cf. sulcatum]